MHTVWCGSDFGIMALLTATDDKVKAHIFFMPISEHSFDFTQMLIYGKP